MMASSTCAGTPRSAAPSSAPALQPGRLDAARDAPLGEEARAVLVPGQRLLGGREISSMIDGRASAFSNTCPSSSAAKPCFSAISPTKARTSSRLASSACGGRGDRGPKGEEQESAVDEVHGVAGAGQVATSLRREWMDMRIPKPAMRVTIDVPP